jgi:hypothetical protein
MRLGLMPSQQEYLRTAVRDAGKYRTARRRFLAWLGLSVAGSSAAAFYAGRSTTGARETQPEISPQLAQMRKLALAPIQQLESAYGTFLATLDDHSDDETLWLGYERLCYQAMVMERPQIKQRLLLMMRTRQLPVRVQDIAGRLAAKG